MSEMFFFFFNNFFQANNENRIGFKKLSKSDLGLGTSHQTHIGLYEDVCTFLGNEDIVTQAMLIYNDYCDILTCSFDRIAMPDGNFRSPKIKTGDNRNDSVVGKIREFAREKPEANWYLAWAGLDSDELVFWLICDDSEDFSKAKTFFPEGTKVLTENDLTFKIAIKYLLDRINFVSGDLKEELEIASQVGNTKYNFKPKDIEKANKRFQEIGRFGEELVNDYLDKQKAEGLIRGFEWVNKSRESGLPYDFLINGGQYVDVKSTDSSFNLPIFFSGEEISFATKLTPRSYSVFRVFDMKTELRKLKICNECSRYLASINGSLSAFKNSVEIEKSILKTVKLGVDPGYCFQEISDCIHLN